MFFRFLAKTMENQKKFLKKILYFHSGHFENKSCLIVFDFVDLRHVQPFFCQLPPPICDFQTKHIGMIPTVQILCINAKSCSKNLLHDLRTHKAHYGTHFARNQRKKSIKFAINLLKT